MKEKTSNFIKKTVLSLRMPPGIANNFIALDKAGIRRIEDSLRENFFSRFTCGYLSTDWGQRDLTGHLTGRLEDDRYSKVPWLNGSKKLKGAKILEIGCGTGCATVALAEQGAFVTGVDIDEGALAVAKDRCLEYGLNAELLNINATQIKERLKGRHFDFIIFYASLEHMLIEERLCAMKDTWEMLSEGGLWVITETPNRLWYFDAHTSMLPFMMWLPDDLAFRYAKFSKRDNFKDKFTNFNADSMTDFLRQGRGVSYHEFELAMKNVDGLNIASTLNSFRKKRYFPVWNLMELSLKGRYKQLLSKVVPRLHKGFLQEYLDIIIVKR